MAGSHSNKRALKFQNLKLSANKGLGRGVCETKSKNGRSRPRKPFISRVFVLGGGLRPWSRKGPESDHGLGVDPETVKLGN